MQYLAGALIPLAFATCATGAVTVDGHVDPATRRGLAARPNSVYLTRALVATATGHTLFDVGGLSDPTVSKVHSQLSEIERNCDATLRGTTSVPDRIGAAAIETNPRDELNLVDALTRITAHNCSRYSLDSMLTAYVLERKAGAQHAKVIAELVADRECPNFRVRGAETFPRRRSALATNRPTRWESRYSILRNPSGEPIPVQDGELVHR